MTTSLLRNIPRSETLGGGSVSTVHAQLSLMLTTAPSQEHCQNLRETSDILIDLNVFMQYLYSSEGSCLRRDTTACPGLEVVVNRRDERGRSALHRSRCDQMIGCDLRSLAWAPDVLPPPRAEPALLSSTSCPSSFSSCAHDFIALSVLHKRDRLNTTLRPLLSATHLQRLKLGLPASLGFHSVQAERVQPLCSHPSPNPRQERCLRGG